MQNPHFYEKLGSDHSLYGLCIIPPNQPESQVLTAVII
jgi:hypothetical protein